MSFVKVCLTAYLVKLAYQPARLSANQLIGTDLDSSDAAGFLQAFSQFSQLEFTISTLSLHLRQEKRKELLKNYFVLFFFCNILHLVSMFFLFLLLSFLLSFFSFYSTFSSKW